jgi:hypothetical protein
MSGRRHKSKMSCYRHQTKTTNSNNCSDVEHNHLLCRSGQLPGKWFFGAILLLCVLVSPCQSIRFLGETDTYAKYPKWDACINASIAFEFRTRQKDGLLMYTDDNGKYDYLQVSAITIVYVMANAFYYPLCFSI